MPVPVAIAIFGLSLALSVTSSLVLARAVDRVGARLSLSEGLLGLLTALGADAPEIAAAVAALLGGQRQLGVGVVLGSNIFNLAALLGLSAVVAGRVRIHRQGLLLEGGVALLVTAVAALLLLGVLGPGMSLLLLALLLVPYVALAGLRMPQVERLKSFGPVGRFLAAARADVDLDAYTDRAPGPAGWTDALALAPALVVVVVASVGMVRAATILGRDWGLSAGVVGTLLLAGITSIPNALAAVRLARHGRGAAVVSAAVNSNTLNVLSGIALPALLIGVGMASGATLLAAWWLLGMTLAALLLTGVGGGLVRPEGAILIALYLAFAAVIVAAH